MKRPTVLRTAFCAVLALAPLASLHAGTELRAAAGVGFDWETAEDSPLRCLAGVGMTTGPLDLALTFDGGLPWEPAALLDADLTLADLEFLRLGCQGAAWYRVIGSVAAETGMRVGARAELGPRFLALAAAGGWAVQSTSVPAVGTPLSDSAPWAHLGVALRPGAPWRLELAMASDAFHAIWLRTSFELSGSWEPAAGLRIDGLFALHYSDFFTLTSYLDGFEARVAVRMPLGRLP